MKCEHCPVNSGLACLGETHRIADHWPLCADVANGLPGRKDQLTAHSEGRLSSSVATAETLSRVRECPSRGNVLPISQQPEHCQKCGELSECKALKGSTPGRVSLRECIECVTHT